MEKTIQNIPHYGCLRAHYAEVLKPHYGTGKPAKGTQLNTTGAQLPNYLWEKGTHHGKTMEKNTTVAQ